MVGEPAPTGSQFPMPDAHPICDSRIADFRFKLLINSSIQNPKSKIQNPKSKIAQFPIPNFYFGP
jgi:hypothetical protein